MSSRDTVDLVVIQLRLMGFEDGVLDPEEIAADLAERSRLNETLETLVGESDLAPAPATFRPEWPS